MSSAEFAQSIWHDRLVSGTDTIDKNVFVLDFATFIPLANVS